MLQSILASSPSKTGFPQSSSACYEPKMPPQSFYNNYAQFIQTQSEWNVHTSQMFDSMANGLYNLSYNNAILQQRLEHLEKMVIESTLKSAKKDS